MSWYLTNSIGVAVARGVHLYFLNAIALALLKFAYPAHAASQAAASQAAATAALPGYKIAGTVVSNADAHALGAAKVLIQDTKDAKKSQTVITGADGRYEFSGVPAGKYSLVGSRRGFITASYDQHDQYSTAIVTGAGIDTEHLNFKLAPDAVIAGKILDEANEPIRHAQVTLYYTDHSSGVDKIRQLNSEQTNDLGEYEFTPVVPGSYYISAKGTPWYAVHPPSPAQRPAAGDQAEQDQAGQDQTQQSSPSVDRSLDVAYPITYYPNVTDVDDALPIPVRGGDHVEADFHLTPVPSLHLFFKVSENGNSGWSFPQLEQPGFDGASTFISASGGTMVRPGVMEIMGVPAGRYNVRMQQQGNSIHMNGVDLNSDGEEIDPSKSDAEANVKITVRVAGESSLPSELILGLRSGRQAQAMGQAVDAKGEVEFPDLTPGRHEIVAFGAGQPYAIVHASAEGADVSGHILTVPAGSSASVSLTLVAGTFEVEGIAKKAGKGFAGAMVVLVPENPENNRDLFRRDQSDLDGTFLLRNVIPGTYTILAIENGWDLDWSQPGVIAAYAKRGRRVVVGNEKEKTQRVSDAVEVQAK